MKKSTLIFIILSAVASFFNYAIYPVLARILGDQEFISMTVALALFTQLSSFTLAIVALTIGLSKQKNETEAKIVIEKLQTIIIHLFIAILFVLLVTSPFYFDKLEIGPSLILPICGMLILSISMSVISGYLNGKKRLVKLGIALAFSAALQFIFSVSIGAITNSGVASLYAMAIASFIAIVLTYRIYRNENLPKLSSFLVHKMDIYRSGELRQLVRYTALSSVAVLVMNILLILDLLLINSRQIDAKLYTDMYVVSRLVFFSGMLFVWPFLSNIDIYRPNNDIKLLIRISGLFIAITIFSILLMFYFGDQIIKILIGSTYTLNANLKEIAILSIMYKFMYLMIITFTLYFVVIRSYWAIFLPIVLALGTWVIMSQLSLNATTLDVLKTLNAISGVGLFIGLLCFAKTTRRV